MTTQPQGQPQYRSQVIPGQVQIRFQGLPDDVAKAASALSFVFSGRASNERPDRDAPTVRRFMRIPAKAAEAVAGRTNRERRQLALLRAICDSYPNLTVAEIFREVLDRDPTDAEITREWGADIAARTRHYVKDGGR